MHDSQNSDLKQSIEAGELPKYLYKFIEINDRLDDILRNTRMWFSKPDSFNDPFDCQLKFQTVSNTEEEIKAHFIGLEEVTPQQAEAIAANAFAEPEVLHSVINDVKNEQINKLGVCCFSLIWDNILMWSHYTKSHKGVVLKFNVLNDLNFFVTPFHVNYSETYPKLYFITDPKESVNKILTTKSKHWGYEQELRVIKASPDYHSFERLSLEEIIFGVNTPTEDIHRIQDLVKSSEYPNVQFKQVILKDEEFGLDLKEIK